MQTQYPDPDVGQISHPLWYGKDNGQAPFMERDSNLASSQSSSHYGIPPGFPSDGDKETFAGLEDTQNMDFFDGLGFGEDEIAEIDPDYRDFRAEMRKYRDDIYQLRNPGAGNGGADDEAPLGDLLGPNFPGQRQGSQQTGPRKPKVLRGPRKAAPQTAEIRLRMGQASQAFIEQDYTRAKIILTDVIRINAETFEAWTTLSQCFEEENDTDNAFKTLFFAAHLQPKSSAPWISAANFALERTGLLRSKYLSNAQFCLGAALRVDPDNLDLRMRKADILIERGHIGAAVLEYKGIISRKPHDTELLRIFAEVCMEQGRYQDAIEAYNTTIGHFKAHPGEGGWTFTWTDVDIVIALYEEAGRNITAIEETKSLGRWLLGRSDEIFWANYTSNDCEWDMDDSRRALIPDFVAGQHPSSTYGAGLPLEFRVRLGVNRLKLGDYAEATRHFQFLVLQSQEGDIKDYLHLYHQVGELLQIKRYYDQALIYYQLLRQYPDHEDLQLLLDMGECFVKLNKYQEAEECLQSAIKIDATNQAALLDLIKVYEALKKPKLALQYVNEVMRLQKIQQIAPANLTATDRRASGHRSDPSKTRKGRDAGHRISAELAQAERLQNQYFCLRENRDKMRNGDAVATDLWIEAASVLTDDFRSFKTFYPWDKYLRFLGYKDKSRLKAEMNLEKDLTATRQRLAEGLGVNLAEKVQDLSAEIPKDYRGVSFDTWLDIFLEYALCLAKKGRASDSYKICEATKDAIVFYHNREALFLIHICWCMCALMASDEETCVATARFFMKDYQFTTDVYRLFAAITRACHSPVSWYSSGPSQKYILRQIKAMDYALVDDASREKYFQERGSYSALGPNGEPFVNNDMDIALLMLYGHILFTGTSYAYALNYFFRAHALDPDNAMINLNIGLTYVHHALKRQAENRQHLILQGMSFLLRYYESRVKTDQTEQRQEAHYNMARIHHMLGLTHLALPYYLKVLEEVSESGRSEREDLIFDTVYNLQVVYIAAGNLEMADKLSRRWLVV